MMKNLKQIYLLGACIIMGALVYFFIASRTGLVYEALNTALFFGLILFLILVLVQELIIRKLIIYSGLRVILYHSFLYIIALTFASLLSFIFYTIINTTASDFEDFMYEGIIKGLVYVVTIPFSDDQTQTVINPQLRGVLLTIPLMIFLIGLVSIIASIIEIRWKEIKQKQLIADAELKALQAQIEPHFLFNSLNTIVSIVRRNPPKAEELLIKLSDLLHYMFSISNKITHTLRDEIFFTKNYLDLMQARFVNKLQVEWNEKSVNNEFSIPALIFQPVIENAIKHGWQDKTVKFEIQIKVESNEDSTSIEISDNGVGMSQEQLDGLPVKGHAIDNLTERLNLEFQENNLLLLDSEIQKGTTVRIKLPVKNEIYSIHC